MTNSTSSPTVLINRPRPSAITSVVTAPNRSIISASSSIERRRVVRVNPTMSANPTESGQVSEVTVDGSERRAPAIQRDAVAARCRRHT